MVRHKMGRAERAKQFMPFAALKGYYEALRKKEKIVVEKKELAEEYMAELDLELRQVKRNDIITVVYFCKNEYLQVTGKVTKIDKVYRVLKVVNTRINFDDLYSIVREEN